MASKLAVSADFLTSDAVKKLLQKQLAKFSRCLAATAVDEGSKPEDVHRLRVASRRAAVAVEVVFPQSRARRARKILKTLKRARSVCGAARDLDVLLERFLRDSQGTDETLRIEVVQHLVVQRAFAQVAIIDFQRRSQRSIDRRIRKLLRDAKWQTTDSNLGLAAGGRNVIQPQIERFVGLATGHLETHRELHQLRISAKGLRYTIEFLDELRQRDRAAETVELLRKIQGCLGSVNDCAAASAAYARLAGAVNSQAAETLEALAAKAESECDQLAAAFRSWWADDIAVQRNILMEGYWD